MRPARYFAILALLTLWGGVMAVVTFDTLEFTQELEAHGFTNEQAVAMVKLQKKTISVAIDNTLATKTDINQLGKDTKADINQLSKGTKADINQLRTDTKEDINLLIIAIQEARAEAKGDNAKLDKEITAVRGELVLVKWVVFTIFALVALPHIRAVLGL